jgi:hypothetical protein
MIPIQALVATVIRERNYVITLNRLCKIKCVDRAERRLVGFYELGSHDVFAYITKSSIGYTFLVFSIEKPEFCTKFKTAR